MDHLSLEFVKALVTAPAAGSITIYLPTFKKGRETQQNRIRLNNLIKQAKELLAGSSLSNHQLKQQLHDLTDKSKTPDFWQHLSVGMAIFINADQTLIFRLPVKFSESVTLATRFFIKPLLPLLTTNGKFFILTLSQSDVKLYEATREAIDKRFLGEQFPTNLGAITDKDFLKERSSSTTSGAEGTMHGQGKARQEIAKTRLDEFANLVEDRISKILNGETTPLILAGTEYLVSCYQKHNSYPHLLPEVINGSPDETTKQDLHQNAWQIARSYFRQQEKGARTEYKNADRAKVSNITADVVTAALTGKIDTLFMLRDTSIWGHYNLVTGEVVLHQSLQSDSTDLADLAAFQTIANGGRVFSLKQKEMFKDTQLAAVMRY